MTEIEQPVNTDIVLFWACRGRISTGQGDAGFAGEEFFGWPTGWYWQRRTPGPIETGFGSAAGERHGPFRTEARARLNLIEEYRLRAGEQLGKRER
jgi:hypothetical protein